MGNNSYTKHKKQAFIPSKMFIRIFDRKSHRKMYRSNKDNNNTNL